MNVDLRYLGRSGVAPASWGVAMRFAPNLARPRVFYDAELARPLRFREAVSALHDVVVGDLRFHARDRTAYQQWKAEQLRAEEEVRRAAYDRAKVEEAKKISREPIPPGLEADFRKMHGLYWTQRRRWADELRRLDPALFRALVPCDPVVTVAPDVVFFECFSKDESSYGCLSVDRDAFRGESGAGAGTTNVDYSLALYDHFQTLRTYRATRLIVDPSGFEVKVEGHADYREEKIDLPSSWLRGFSQIQAAMSLPSRRVELSVDVVYSILAWLQRHREKKGPRSLKFQLTPGKPPVVVLEPWGIAVPSRGAAYDGDRPEEIKVWGRRRLFALARLLPLVERFEVQLLGSGMPSIWIAHMGEMRFQLALSGWTTNDWTSGAALELLAGDLREKAATTALVTRYLEQSARATLPALAAAVAAPRDELMGALHLLAKQGQLIYDYGAQVYRWRQVMPVALSEAMLGPEPPEVFHGRRLHRERRVKLVRQELIAGGRMLLVADVDGTQCEGILSLDGALQKAKCACSFYFKSRLRAGPCRHLLALKLQASVH